MPTYLADPSFWKSIWPLLLFALLSSFTIAWLFIGLSHQRLFRQTFPVVLAFSILGMAAGNLTGLSREPAVGAVVPGILALVGGTFAYLIGSTARVQQMLVALGITALSTNLLVGVYWGSKTRALFEIDQSVALSIGLLKEDARYAVLLERLLNEEKFLKIKNQLEQADSFKFQTGYDAPKEPAK
jgi:hypothetical protein